MIKIQPKSIFDFLKTIPLFFLLFFSMNSSAQIIPQKLAAPEDLNINPPPSPKPEWVWIKAHWLWDIKKEKYLWVKGKYVKPKKEYTLVDGFWKPLPEGFQWVPGYWERHTGHRYKLKGVRAKKVKPLFSKKEIIYID